MWRLTESRYLLLKIHMEDRISGLMVLGELYPSVVLPMRTAEQMPLLLKICQICWAITVERLALKSWRSCMEVICV